MATVTLTVTAVNDAPINVVPAAQTTSEDTSIVFLVSNLLGVSDIDAGSNPLRVTLSVMHGTLTLSGTSG